MVRSYDYTIPKEEVLSLCQEAIVSLGYEIDTYDAIDRHFVTKTKKIKRTFQPIDYVLFVKVDDRIYVYVYAEERTFRRASEMGIRAGDLLVQDASNNLSLRFQRSIFSPITQEFSKKGFVAWDEQKGNQREDRRIAEYEKRRKKKVTQYRKKKQAEMKSERKQIVEKYTLERDLARIESVLEAEHQVTFFKDVELDSSGRDNWSIIQINKIVIGNDDRLRQIILEVMKDYPDYQGIGKMEWVIGPDGRVVESGIQLETSFNTPEDELSHQLVSMIRTLFFPLTHERVTFVRVSRQIEFSGSRHNIRYNFGRARFVQLLERFPSMENEIIPDTFFTNPIILR